MKDFEFESGVVTYRINGKREVSFNPNDVEFLEKLFTAFGELDETQAKYQRQLEKGRGTKEIFAIARKLDEEMRSTIDGVFGEGFCADVFGTMNVNALAKGLPAWANLILAFMDEVNGALVAEKKQTDSRVKKYVAKYKSLK